MDRIRGSRRRTGSAATLLVVLTLALAGCGASDGAAVEAGSAAPPPTPASTSTAGPTAAATTTPAPTAPPTGAGIPDAVRLPDEGGRSTTAEFTDWITDESLGTPWLLDPCGPTAYPTDRQRTGFRTVDRRGPEAHDARQLGRYPTPEVAAEVVAGFRRALAACRTGRSGDTAWTWVTADVAGLGDDGFLAASTYGGPEQAGHGSRVAVTRVGTDVFLAYASGEYYVAEIDDGARSAQQVAQRFLDSL